jgi:hypothetical protein
VGSGVTARQHRAHNFQSFCREDTVLLGHSLESLAFRFKDQGLTSRVEVQRSGFWVYKYGFGLPG